MHNVSDSAPHLHAKYCFIVIIIIIKSLFSEGTGIYKNVQNQ